MPIQESASVSKIEECQTSPKNALTKNGALLLLREREVLTYHHICEVFRAQGHLTPEKLKLLKEIAAALYIPDVRHRAECRLAADNNELNAIAECVAGPGTDEEWRKEGVEMVPPVKPGQINAAALKLADAMAAAVQAHWKQLDNYDENTVVTKTIRLRSNIFEEDFSEPEKEIKSEVSKQNTSDNNVEELSLDDSKEEDRDGDTSSSVSSASDDSQPKEDESQAEESTAQKEDKDASLMPPPPPVMFLSSPAQCPSSVSPTASTLSPTPPVITVPSASTSISVPETSSEDPQIIEAPIDKTPILSEAEEAQARADFFSSLPPLVVVPPPDPSETAVVHSPLPQSPAMVLSPGVSMQITDDDKKRKRTLSQSHESSIVTSVSPTKTMALSPYSKVTPVMVSSASPTSSQTQLKVTPIISRAKMATTSQTQKVIIVSNASTSNTPILHRSLGSVGLPVIRASQPRFQPVPAAGTGGGGSPVRPKVVTVPAKCRAKGSSTVNLQLKNAITLKQDNVTVVDTNVKRLHGPTKILPKPSGSMFIVNTGHGTHKLATTVAGGRLGTSEGTKQNVVIVQKGMNQRTLTLSNPNKDLMQKLMSKKCVVIQSSKVVQKTISPKQPPVQTPPVTTTSSNVVVLDLSQEQYRQNLSGTTIAEILQASGIITSGSQPVTSTLSEAAQEGEWLPVETRKSLSLEEVSLPLGQSESFVTLDEAVGMLEDQHTDASVLMSEGGVFNTATSEQMFTITPEQLSSGNLAVMADKSESMDSQVIIETLPSEVDPDLHCMSQTFLPHKDGAVTIQHSNIDVPTNMSLEDYSSQQMENQNFN